MAKVLSVLFMLVGLCAFAFSLWIAPQEQEKPYAYLFLREGGVVVFSVFAVKLIYESAVARGHFREFSAMLALQLQAGESNAAVASRLGIRRIYATRNEYQQQYPLNNIVQKARPGSTLRIVGQSLFLLLGRGADLHAALGRGVQVNLCLMHPDTEKSELDKLPHLTAGDLEASASLIKQLARQLSAEKREGIFEVRFHRIHLFDSYSSFQLEDDASELVAWDLSFGRDPSDKRVILAEKGKPFGQDLARRYDAVWRASQCVYSFQGGRVRTGHDWCR
jgi:hypothetical protein